MLTYAQSLASNATYAPVLSTSLYQQQIQALLEVAGTYDAWLALLREVNPHFEFTDPPVRRSLPITLALAARTSRPTAVLTGPHHRLGDWPGPAEPDPVADPADLVRARIDGTPLTAAAALVWNGDLPRLLQQVLFDTADSVVF